MGAVDGEPTAAAWAADYLKDRYQKPGNVFVGVVSRLDSFVTGVLILARTSKAASRLTEQFRERHTSKLYLACVEGELKRTKLEDTLKSHCKKRFCTSHGDRFPQNTGRPTRNSSTTNPNNFHHPFADRD